MRHKLDPEQPLNTLGFDSLMAVELSIKIEKNLKINLPKMVLLKSGLNALELTKIIDKELSENKTVLYIEKENVSEESENDSNSKTVEAKVNDKSSEVDVENLSDDEVDLMLKTLISNKG